MSEQERKKRVRGGHKGSVTRIIAQAREILGAEERDSTKLTQLIQTLKEKRDILTKLDSEILETLAEEQDIVDEISQADEFQEGIDLIVIQIQTALADFHGTTNSQRDSPELQGSADPSQTGQNASNTVHGASPNLTERRSESPAEQSSASPSRDQQPNRRLGPKVKLPKLTLRKFNGDLTSWSTFWDSFKSSIHENSELSSIDKFIYLNSLLEGPAAAAVAGLTLSEANYEEAVKVLTKRFGNRQQIIAQHMDALMNMEGVSSIHDMKGLRHLYDSLESHTRSLHSLGVSSSSYGSLLSSVFVNKLPKELRVVISKEFQQEEWDFDSLLEIVEKEINARERASCSINLPSKKPPKEHPTVAALISGGSPTVCIFCSQPHPSSQCRTVTDIRKRKESLMKSGRCFVCLRKGHIGRDCRSAVSCSNCGKRHHASICDTSRALHSNDSQGSSPRPARQTTTQAPSTSSGAAPGHQSSQLSPVLSMYVNALTPVLLQTATVQVFRPDRPSVSMYVRLILDSGSQRSYVLSRLEEALALPVQQIETLMIKTFGSEGKMQVCNLVNLAIQTRDGHHIVLPFLSVPAICEPITGQPVTVALERFPHLSRLDLADCGNAEGNLDITILVGADNYWKLVTGRVQRGKDGPTAMHTVLGWVLSGPIPGFVRQEDSVSLMTVHALEVDASTLECSNCALDRRLRDFWNLETLGIQENESSVYDLFIQGIRYEGGRYCVQLPWKEVCLPLSDNFDLCQRRLYSLLKRLRLEPRILQEYHSVITDQIKGQIVEVVKDPLQKADRVYYLPHHAVIRTDKQTTKLRVVYDASAKVNGLSLNESLYTGPSFGQSIFDILLRFRLHKVALIADIEKAFLMVGIDEKDRDALRFLWIDDINSNLPRIEVLRFARVAFGVSSSPFLLNATIRHHVEQYRAMDPGFADKFERSIYVDDLTCSVTDEDEAFQLYLKSKEWLNQGGFNLRKFLTNSQALQARIDRCERLELAKESAGNEKTVKSEELSYAKCTLGSSLVSAEGVKVLGLCWNPSDDTLCFNIQQICALALELEPTKRIVVGTAARIYDPLGILAPITVQFKIMFQELCTSKLDWNEQLSGELLTKWKKFLNGFRQMPSIVIPRPFLLGNSVTSYSLCGFSDASLQAYAAVIYLQAETPEGIVVRLACSKTRVCPLKKPSIPRLELLGALLLSRLISNVQHALSAEVLVDSVTCYTDSKVVLYWIRGEGKDWKPFVQNRVNEVRRLVPSRCWKHCCGSDNPADLPSRGLDIWEQTNRQLWFNGPCWLTNKTKSDVECSVEEDEVPQDCIAEMKQNEQHKYQSMHTLLVQGNVSTVIQCEKYSSLSKLLRVTSYVFKFVSKLQAKVSRSAYVPSTGLSSGDIINAEAYWIKSAQILLLQDRRIDNWKIQFGMYTDSHGIWRCKGRLDKADLAGCESHPVLLPTNHHFTALVVKHCHERVKHAGVKETLTELRSRFWIVQGRFFVRKLLFRCVVCKKFDGRPYLPPHPPPLPSFRVNPARAFLYTGLDYAGPLYLKGTDAKVWICLFTCCATRAVHLELVSALTAELFLMCFKRFVARRGVPSKLISDNSTTFTAANVALSHMFQHPDVGSYISGQRIQWEFNLEKAPWWGGFFERLVGSMKKCLKRVIGRARLSYEELSTVLCEVEAILNSRPLSFVSTEDLDEPLTPSHLMMGHRLTSIPDHFLSREDPDFGTTTPAALGRRLSHLTTLLQHFWRRWKLEYLNELREHHRHLKRFQSNSKAIAVGDIVLIYDEDKPRLLWKLGKVETVMEGADGAVRGASVRVKAGGKYAVLNRPVQHLIPLEVNADRDVGSNLPAELPPSEEPVNNESGSHEIVGRPQRSASLKARERIINYVEDLDES